MARITARDEADIVFYYSAQSMFERSTFGAMVERARNVAHNSDGHKIKLDYRSWSWQPNADDMPPMHVRKRAGDGEQGYVVDDDQLMRFARVSRRMMHVERAAPAAKRTLEAYYGDRGARWASVSADDKATGKVVRKGVGPGSIAALYTIAPLGVAFLVKERERAASRAAGGASLSLSDDELLASVFAVQAVKHDATRAIRLGKVRDEAEALLARGWAEWLKAPRFDRRTLSSLSRFEGTYRDGYGAKVSWHYTSDQHDRDCAHCKAGCCEQRIESSPSWASSRVTHNEPRSIVEVA